jgi:hypothetical protein
VIEVVALLPDEVVGQERRGGAHDLTPRQERLQPLQRLQVGLSRGDRLPGQAGDGARVVPGLRYDVQLMHSFLRQLVQDALEAAEFVDQEVLPGVERRRDDRGVCGRVAQPERVEVEYLVVARLHFAWLGHVTEKLPLLVDHLQQRRSGQVQRHLAGRKTGQEVLGEFEEFFGPAGGVGDGKRRHPLEPGRHSLGPLYLVHLVRSEVVEEKDGVVQQDSAPKLQFGADAQPIVYHLCAPPHACPINLRISPR